MTDANIEAEVLERAAHEGWEAVIAYCELTQKTPPVGYLHHWLTTRAKELRKEMTTVTEWQYRMPEDRGAEGGWMYNTKAGATYLQRTHGAEVRTRTVTHWVTEAPHEPN